MRSRTATYIQFDQYKDLLGFMVIEVGVNRH